MVIYEDDNEGFAELEEIPGGYDPEIDFHCACIPLFLSHKNPEFLPLAEEPVDDINDGIPARVIFERDGVPYIDGDACNRGKIAKEDLDDKFARLVEAVVYNKGP